MVTVKKTKRQLTSCIIAISITLMALIAILPGCVMRADLFGSHLLADLVIRQGSNYISDGDGLFDFGNAGLFSSVSVVFTVENTGHGPLNLLGISSVNEPVPQYHIDTTSLNTTLYAGQSSTFTVTFKPCHSNVCFKLFQRYINWA